MEGKEYLLSLPLLDLSQQIALFLGPCSDLHVGVASGAVTEPGLLGVLGEPCPPCRCFPGSSLWECRSVLSERISGGDTNVK